MTSLLLVKKPIKCKGGKVGIFVHLLVVIFCTCIAILIAVNIMQPSPVGVQGNLGFDYKQKLCECSEKKDYRLSTIPSRSEYVCYH